MLTKDQEYILALLRAGLASEPVDVSPENEEHVIRIIRTQDILLTVYPYVTPSLREKLRIEAFGMTSHIVNQMYEAELILHALADAGMRCVPLKGLEQGKLYPEDILRQMADLDILVRPYDYKRVKEVMDSLGYISDGESSWMHDNFAKGDITVEMHKRLTDDSGAIREWESRMLERTSQDKDGVFHMTLEDQMIFHIVHMHKDFLNGSLGLRRIVDVWLLQKQKMDTEFVKQEMEHIGLSAFYDRMKKLAHVCMGECMMDEDMELLLKHAFQHGIYGSQKSYKTGRIVSMSKGKGFRKGKYTSFAAAIFLPVSRMKAHFPILEKYPFLLPYFWIKRIANLLQGNMRDFRQMIDYSDLTEEDYEEMQHFFRAGGCRKDLR